MHKKVYCQYITNLNRASAVISNTQPKFNLSITMIIMTVTDEPLFWHKYMYVQNMISYFMHTHDCFLYIIGDGGMKQLKQKNLRTVIYWRRNNRRTGDDIIKLVRNTKVMFILNKNQNHFYYGRLPRWGVTSNGYTHRQWLYHVCCFQVNLVIVPIPFQVDKWVCCFIYLPNIL